MAAAAGPSTSGQDLDIYGDLIQNDEDLDRLAEANELYDAVLTGSVNQDQKSVPAVAPPTKAPIKERSKTPELTTCTDPQKKFPLYIGNFSWWTSDKDLLQTVQTLGVKDVIEIKFAENRINGQSRGFAEVVVASKESFRTLLEKIPQCKINGDRVDCRFANRQNLTMFEEIANKRIPLRVFRDSKDSDSSDKIPSLFTEEPPPPPIPPLFPPHPIVNRFPSIPSPFSGHPPPLYQNMPPAIPPPMPPHMFPPHPLHIPNQPPPSLHINPAFFPPSHDGHSSKAYNQQKHMPESTDREMEDQINRNRAIASSAITKAVTGATAGEMQVAMETLLTAIAIIKQSRVYGDERCQALVTSLKDCLVSIQGNRSHRSSSRSGDKDRDRDRGRDRERDRERDRDRYRENPSSWEAAGMSRRHRERSWSGDRDKERSRERERHREHRDHRDRYR